MIGHHWFSLWFVYVRQQAITRISVYTYLCHHIASLGQNGLSNILSRVAHGWGRFDANVISLYWLPVIFKMLSGLNGTKFLILQYILKILIALKAQFTLAIMNFNFTIQRWEIIYDQFG